MPSPKIGSISWTGSGWRVLVERGRTPDGKRRRRTCTVYGTRAEAQAKAALMAQEMGRSNAFGDTMTLREYWETVFPHRPSVRGTPRSNATMICYAKGMRHPLEVLGDRPLSKLTHAEIRAAVLSSPSPKNAKTCLRAVLRCAYDDELMDEMPFQRRVPTPRKKRPQQEPWSRFEVASFFSALDSRPLDPKEDRDALELFAILGLCGLSKSEALGTRPQDVRDQSTYSWETGEELRTLTVTVATTYTDDDGFKPWAKNDHRHRTVPVPPVFRDRLRRLVSVSRAQWAGDPSEWAATRLVRKRGDNLTHDWKRLCRRLGVRYIPPGMLRHTTDTLAITAGVGGDLNDKMHGRSEHASTYAHYFRPDMGAMEDAARRLSDAISGATPTDSQRTDVREP